MSIPASAKYAIIREMTMRDNNRLNLSRLCETAGVSGSDTTVTPKARICGSNGNNMTEKNSSGYWRRISSEDTAKALAAFICG